MASFIKLPKPLILASKSPRRAQLLRQIGLDFRVIASSVPETVRNHRAPEKQAMELSLVKARDVAEKLDTGIIVAADTMVVLRGKVLGKPEDFDDAFRMLRFLSGQTHQVYTGFALLDVESRRYVTDFECTRVTFRHLSDGEISEYLRLEHPFDKAGAYGIQDRSALFVEKIDGCYYNVVGFPLAKFYVHLKTFLQL